MCFVCVLHRLNATLFRSHSCALQSSAAALRIGSAVVRVRWCCGLHAALQVHCFIIMRFILFDFPDLTRSRSLDLDLFLSVHDSNLTANNTTRLSVRALKWACPCLDCRQNSEITVTFWKFAWYGYGEFLNKWYGNTKHCICQPSPYTNCNPFHMHNGWTN